MSTSEIFGATGAIAVTASDTTDFVPSYGKCSRGLAVKITGDYKLTMENGSTCTVYLAAGIIHPIRCKRVWSTGSISTSGIVAFV